MYHPIDYLMDSVSTFYLTVAIRITTVQKVKRDEPSLPKLFLAVIVVELSQCLRCVVELEDGAHDQMSRLWLRDITALSHDDDVVGFDRPWSRGAVCSFDHGDVEVEEDIALFNVLPVRQTIPRIFFH